MLFIIHRLWERRATCGVSSNRQASTLTPPASSPSGPSQPNSERALREGGCRRRRLRFLATRQSQALRGRLLPTDFLYVQFAPLSLPPPTTFAWLRLSRGVAHWPIKKELARIGGAQVLPNVFQSRTQQKSPPPSPSVDGDRGRDNWDERKGRRGRGRGRGAFPAALRQTSGGIIERRRWFGRRGR